MRLVRLLLVVLAALAFVAIPASATSTYRLDADDSIKIVAISPGGIIADLVPKPGPLHLMHEIVGLTSTFDVETTNSQGGLFITEGTGSNRDIRLAGVTTGALPGATHPLRA